jgi:hypothetical protein
MNTQRSTKCRRTRRGVPLAVKASEIETMKATLMLSAVLTLTTVSAHGGDALTLAVSPKQAFAPSNLRIRARVAPDPANRLLEIVAESVEFYRSSQIQLEGDQAPATITFEFRGVPGGDYEVSALLIDNLGRRRAVARDHVSIIPQFGR